MKLSTLAIVISASMLATAANAATYVKTIQLSDSDVQYSFTNDWVHISGGAVLPADTPVIMDGDVLQVHEILETPVTGHFVNPLSSRGDYLPLGPRAALFYSLINSYSDFYGTLSEVDFEYTLKGYGDVTSYAMAGTLVQFYTGAPEPSTWELMLVGVGALGAALRRRKPSSVPAAV